MMMNDELIVLAGVTGTGKTDLSLRLAELLAARGRAAEIINADSMQFYRGMDIGTAKLSHGDRARFPHHLFDILDVTETATVADYQLQARQTIAEIQQRGAVPIMVGGTGLYISAVLYDFRFPGSDPEVRAKLESQAELLGAETLWQQLHLADPEAAENIGQENQRRIIRALEVISLTGKRYSAQLPDQSAVVVPSRQYFLDGDRDLIRQRLRIRTEQMWQLGLLAETSSLIGRGLLEGATAKKAIGYSQAIAVLNGELNEQQAIEDTWQQTVRYARRQRSWFNRYRAVQRLTFTDPGLAEAILVDLGLGPG